MLGRRQVLPLLLLVVLLTTSLPYPLTAASSADFKLNYNASTVTFRYPEDMRLLRNVTVTNLGSSYFEMIVIPTIHGKNASLGGAVVYPQGAGLVLHPGETQFVSVSLNLANIARVWKTGVSFWYNMSIEIGPITAGKGCAQPNFCIDSTRAQFANLTNIVQVLCTCTTLPANSSVTGHVYDRATALPIAGAKVSVQGSPLNFTSVTTDSAGLYNLSVTAFKSADTGAWAPLDVHVSVPNSTYFSSDAIVVPQQNSTTIQDFLLSQANQNSSYRLLSRFSADGGLNLGRGTFSGNGSYFAAVTYATGNAAQANLAANSSLYFFASNGTLLWKFPTFTPTSAVDVSDDAKYVAVASGSANNTNPELANVFGTKGNRVWTLNATSVPGSKANLSLYWTPDMWTSLKFSHNDSLFAAGTRDGFLYLFSVSTRQVIWEKFLGGTIDGLRFTSDGSVVYASSGDGYLYAFSTGPAGTSFWKAYTYGGTYGFGFSDNYIVVSPRIGNYLVLVDRSGNQVWRVPVEASYPNAKMAINQQFLAYFGASAFPYSGIVNINSTENILFGPATTGAISLDAKYVLWSGLETGVQGGTSIVLYDTSGHALLNYTDSTTNSQTGCGGGPSWVGSQETRLMVVSCGYVYFLAGYVTTTFQNSVTVGGQAYQVPVVSNSTISNFVYDPSVASVSFSSSLLSRALFNVTLPSAVLSGNFTVTADGSLLQATVAHPTNTTSTVSFVCGYRCGSIVIAAPSSSTTTTTTTTSNTSTTTSSTSTNSTTGGGTTTVTVTQTGSTTPGQSSQFSTTLFLEILGVTLAGGVVVIVFIARRPKAA